VLAHITSVRWSKGACEERAVGHVHTVMTGLVPFDLDAVRLGPAETSHTLWDLLQ
jgi:hypothetical protein